MDDADGEVSLMSAPNKTCGIPNAAVAKVFGPGDCCKVTSEDTVAPIGGIATIEDSGSEPKDMITDVPG